MPRCALEDEVADGDRVIDAISTAPAAMSLASFAFGSKDVVVTSITPSIAVFSISATSTKAIASTSAIS
jgi:hypothetical protein